MFYMPSVMGGLWQDPGGTPGKDDGATAWHVTVGGGRRTRRDGVAPHADGAPGCCGLAVGGGVTPSTASAAESIWSRFLVGVDLVSNSKGPDPVTANAAESRLARNCSYHRGGAILLLLEPGPDLRPAQPPNLCRDVDPAVLRLKLLPKLSQTSTLLPAHVPDQGDVDSNPHPFLLGDNFRDTGVDRSGCLE